MKMQKEAREMKKQMEQIIVKGYSKDELVKITLNGAQEIVSVKVDSSLLDPDKKEKLENDFKEAYKEVQKKLQKEMMKGMDMDQLKSMFSGN
jgi:hypothetical protein